MVDVTARLFWCRVKELGGNMADKLNDFVYSDDSKETVDVVNLLLLGWILLGLVVYIIGNVIAKQISKRKCTEPPETTLVDEPEETETFEHVSLETESNEPAVVVRPVVVPTCSGDDPEIVDWIDNVFKWVYGNRIVSPVVDSWISALNARTRLISTDHGILVDFKDLTHTASSPIFEDVTQSFSHRGDLSATCQADIEDLVFDVVVTQIKDSDKITIPFVLKVSKLTGKMCIECVPEDLTFIARFSELPETELCAEQTNLDENQDLSDLVCEIATDALQSAIINLRFSCFSECPRLIENNISSDVETFESAPKDNEDQLLVKIIKASELGGDEDCIEPYCVVEMDEPPQKFETRGVEEKHDPSWNESFTFIIKDISAELLFEIYDKGKPSTENFLGLGIVSVDELITNPSQRQVIPLQSRPLEDDNVTGTLTTEFVFVTQKPHVTETVPSEQHNALNDAILRNGKTVEKNSRVTAGGTVITTTTIKRTKEEVLSNQDASANPINDPRLTTTSELQGKQNGGVLSHVEANNNVAANNLNGFRKVLDAPDETEIFMKLPDKEAESLEIEENIAFIANDLRTEDSNEKADCEALPVACSAALHEMAVRKTPIIVINPSDAKPHENGFVVLNAVRENGFMHDVEKSLHENGIIDCISLDLSSSSLPPIAEIVEISSASTKSLDSDTDVEADLTSAALKEIENNKPAAPSKSTLIIHSVQRPDNSLSESLEASPASAKSKDTYSVPSSPSQELNSDERSRPKEKKSFIGTLRRRLSFKKTRSRSAENQSESTSTYSHGSSRSASTDRVRHVSGSKPSPFRTPKFMGRRFLAIAGSTRSSLSEASGISTSSTRTYISENSTLVIETNENGIIKRYLIPNSLIRQSKWKKRGIKLHIYNDHVFVAKHVSGVTLCQVCRKYLTRRPGKQGYECRGCNLQCHKRCHVKVATFCSNSTINSMEVEYIQDPNRAIPKTV